MPECQEHTATIFDKGGTRPLFELDGLFDVRWSRRLDDTSVAHAYVNVAKASCSKELGEIFPMRHELAIYNNGDKVWEGPITYTKESRGVYRIDAKDVSFYTNRLGLSLRYASYRSDGSETVLNRLERMFRYEVRRLERDPRLSVNMTSHLQFYTSAGDARTTKVTEPYEKYLFEELDDLAWRNGVDYGTVGRRMYFMDVHNPIGRIRQLTQEDFEEDIEVITYGAEICTIAYVSDRTGRYASAGPGHEAFYGLIELVQGSYYDDEDDESQPEIPLHLMQEQAERDFAPRYPFFSVVRVPENTSLNLDTFSKLRDQLVPGVRAPISSNETTRRVQQMLKLKTLNVRDNQNGVVVSVTFVPASEENGNKNEDGNELPPLVPGG